MADAWHVARSTRTCAETGEAIPPETPYYSALLETDSGFDRRDFSAGAWPEVDTSGFSSYWKNKGYSPRGDRKPPVDYERMLSVFDALDSAEEKPKRLLRYVLALVLVRKRKLRLDDMGRTEQGEDRVTVHDRRGDGKTIEVVSPPATREELQETQEKLNQLFDHDFDEQGAASG